MWQLHYRLIYLHLPSVGLIRCWTQRTHWLLNCTRHILTANSKVEKFPTFSLLMQQGYHQLLPTPHLFNKSGNLFWHISGCTWTRNQPTYFHTRINLWRLPRAFKLPVIHTMKVFIRSNHGLKYFTIEIWCDSSFSTAVSLVGSILMQWIFIEPYVLR